MTGRELRILCFGVLIGLTAGAAAGLLNAPHTGRVTRRKLRRAGAELQDRIVEKGEAWVDSSRDFMDKAAKTARTAVGRA